MTWVLLCSIDQIRAFTFFGFGGCLIRLSIIFLLVMALTVIVAAKLALVPCSHATGGEGLRGSAVLPGYGSLNLGALRAGTGRRQARDLLV